MALHYLYTDYKGNPMSAPSSLEGMSTSEEEGLHVPSIGAMFSTMFPPYLNAGKQNPKKKKKKREDQVVLASMWPFSHRVSDWRCIMSGASTALMTNMSIYGAGTKHCSRATQGSPHSS